MSQAKHLSACARLNEASRFQRPGARRHLLSGTAKCGACGDPLYVLVNKRKRGQPRPSYVCRTHGCFKVSIGLEDLDEFVAEAVVTRLSRPDVVEAVAASGGEDYSAARDQLEALVARRVEVGHALANGLDLVAARTALEDLARQIADAEARLRATVQDPLVASVAGEGARAAWERLSAEQRSTLVRLVVTPVVHPTQRARTKGFDADRIELRWL